MATSTISIEPFRQMFENTNKVAKSLIACDIKKGDVVALWTPNLAEFIYCKFIA